MHPAVDDSASELLELGSRAHRVAELDVAGPGGGRFRRNLCSVLVAEEGESLAIDGEFSEFIDGLHAEGSDPGARSAVVLRAVRLQVSMREHGRGLHRELRPLERGLVDANSPRRQGPVASFHVDRCDRRVLPLDVPAGGGAQVREDAGDHSRFCGDVGLPEMSVASDGVREPADPRRGGNGAPQRLLRTLHDGVVAKRLGVGTGVECVCECSGISQGRPGVAQRLCDARRIPGPDRTAGGHDGVYDRHGLRRANGACRTLRVGEAQGDQRPLAVSVDSHGYQRQLRVEGVHAQNPTAVAAAGFTGLNPVAEMLMTGATCAAPAIRCSNASTGPSTSIA